MADRTAYDALTNDIDSELGRIRGGDTDGVRARFVGDGQDGVGGAGGAVATARRASTRESDRPGSATSFRRPRSTCSGRRPVGTPRNRTVTLEQ